MRFGNWRGVTLALALGSAFATIPTTTASANPFHHDIPRLVPAVDVNTGGPYYAPPVPYGHYAGKDCAGHLNKAVGGLTGGLLGKLHGLGGAGCGAAGCGGGLLGGLGHGGGGLLSGLGHGGGAGGGHAAACGTCGGAGCGFCKGRGLFSHGGGGGGGCGGDASGGNGCGLFNGHGHKSNGASHCGGNGSGNAPGFASTGILGSSQTVISTSPQASMASGLCGETGCGLKGGHRHMHGSRGGGHGNGNGNGNGMGTGGCGQCGGNGCGACGGGGIGDLCGGCGGKRCGLCGFLGHLKGKLCGGCGGAGCGLCGKAKSLLNAPHSLLGALFHKNKIKYFVGPGGPVPITPGYVPYVVTTRSPRDFLAFPPFTP